VDVYPRRPRCVPVASGWVVGSAWLTVTAAGVTALCGVLFPRGFLAAGRPGGSVYALVCLRRDGRRRAYGKRASNKRARGYTRRGRLVGPYHGTSRTGHPPRYDGRVDGT